MYAYGPEPDTSSIFRIASMTKSFVAAAILKLRDEGKLNLDDSVITHIPQMKAIKLPTPDSPELTIRLYRLTCIHFELHILDKVVQIL